MKSEKKKSPMAKGQLLWMIMTGVFTVLFIVSLIAGPVANNYAGIINMVLGTESTMTVGDPGKIYFEADYATAEEQAAAAAAICEQLEANGATLLLNRNNALPLDKNINVTLFSVSSTNFVYSGSGSGGMDASKMLNLKQALEADGFQVNGTMWDFYVNSGYHRESAPGAMNNYVFDNAGFLTNEVPLSAYSQAEWDSVKSYGDAAIVVLSRVAGEGPDLPWYGAGDGTGNILELTKEEQDLLGKIAQMKAEGTVKKIVVLLNMSNAIELDFLEPAICGTDYGIDACMWVGQVGQSGIEAIGDLLNGNYNPSGHLVDTYCYDNLTSPAIQNAHATSYTNAAELGLAFKKTCNEYYVVYQEGIYVGYRYYETRYEDMVLGNANVGSYDYATTVAYPFGFGLSYSTFEYSNFKMTDNGDSFRFTVDVTNTSAVDGQEVVQIYMQSPYTDYDRQNGIEKASVELVGFDKQLVPAGQTVSYTVDVSKQELRTFDANGTGTYIVDAGNYYFAAGNGAHEALNNILMAKAAMGDTTNGTVNVDAMVGTGNAALAAQYVQAAMDTTTYATSAATGNAITTQLDHADLNKVDEDASNDTNYVSRSDWAGTMPKAKITATEYQAAVQIPANDTIYDMLKGPISYEGSSEMPTIGADGDLNLALFVGVPLDGSVEYEGKTYTWDDLLDQVTFSEMVKLVGQTYHCTTAMPSINKPSTKDENGPYGITATLTGGKSSTSYTSEDVRAATFDLDLVKEMGVSMGNDCLMANGKAYSGLYGPGANIHRTPYSGRNGEYYSEDPFISGVICSAEVEGIQSKGVYVYLKHFAMNDQETARDGICVWSNEQAAREIYLQAFEYPIVDGAYCVMTSFNRMGAVWAGGDYNLLTNILRGEWGMRGFVLTDYANANDYMDVVQGLLAGGDGWDCNSATKWSDPLRTYRQDAAVVSAMREATKHILYTVVNSNAMNGISPNLKIVEVRTWWQDAIVGLQIGTGVLAAASTVMLVRTIMNRKRKTQEK